jgi:hypothetical protein
MTVGRRTGSPVPPDAEDMTLLGGGRLPAGNTRPLLELLTMYAGSGFDPTEWAAAELALQQTDDATGSWYTHPILGGVARLVVVMARASEDEVLMRVWGDERAGLNERIDTLFDVGSMFRMSPA